MSHNPTPHTMQDLISLLRNREDWPTAFQWNYNYDCGCAKGLARSAWGQDFSIYNLAETGVQQLELERVLNALPRWLARQLPGTVSDLGWEPNEEDDNWDKIPPELVAMVLEIISSRGKPSA